MMRRIGQIVLLVSAAGALVWAGCARMPEAPRGSAKPLVDAGAWTPTGAGVYLDGASSRVFVHEDGSRSRRTVTPTEGGWRVEVVRLADPGGSAVEASPWRTIELVRLPTERGGVGMHAIEEHPDRGRGAGSRVVFEPAIALVPASASTGEDVTETVDATLTRGGGRAERGQAVRTVRLGGSDRPPMRDGGVAERLEATLDMQFGAVRIRRAEMVWASPGEGIVAESSAVVVSYAGVPVDRRSSLAAVEVEPGRDQPGN